MNERALRDELEQLQAQGLGLEAELLLEHPAVLVRRRELDRAREELAEVERRVLTAAEEQSVATEEITRLATQLQSTEQQRLSWMPFALLLVAIGGTAVLLADGWSSGLAAFGSAGILGLIFGHRFLGWASGRLQRAPKLTRVWRIEALLALGLSLAAHVLAGRLERELHSTGHMDLDLEQRTEQLHLFMIIPVQALAGLAVAVAVRARRTAQLNGEATRTSWLAALVGLITIGAVAIPELVHLAGRSPTLTLSALVAIVPLSWAFLIQRRPAARSFSALFGSLVCAATSLFFTATLLGPFRVDDLYDVGGLWGAIQCAGGALLLGWDFARREPGTSRGRWLGVAAAVVSVAAALARTLV